MPEKAASEIPETVPLFDLLRRQSREYWDAQERKPPDAIWARADLVPMDQYSWYDDLWTCLRRDGSNPTT